MNIPIEDTIWGVSYGSAAAVQAAFDRFGPEYHEAILASGVPAGAAAALLPHLDAGARGIDFGCGSGVLGAALRAAEWRGELDGLDLSPVMLGMAKKSGCYRHLYRTNLLVPAECPALASPYDFAVTVGLMGDYVPYYVALPHLVSVLGPGGVAGFAVERRSTPSRALEKLANELRLEPVSETVLPVAAGKLEEQFYHFFVARLKGRPRGGGPGPVNTK